MAKREERRQKRMMEALERQRELDGTGSSRRREEEEEEEVEKYEEEEVRREEEEEEEEEEKPRRSSIREQVSETRALQDEDADARLAERKLEELKRRRDDTESKEFERLRQKQQEADAQLEGLKSKREERRKVLEEEERQRKQEEGDRKAREEEEKRRMKEEIERRRAEAAEKRQKGEEGLDGEGKAFKCVSPRGSSLKVSPQACVFSLTVLCVSFSSVKLPHSPVVSKIDNRLEQYTSAAQNRESRSPRSGASDLPLVTDGVRSIKSMWEKGNAFSSPGGGAGAFKETAVVKIGVAGRINDWLNKTPESGKTAGGGRPVDLKPVDVTNKRSLWENKGTTPTKVALIKLHLFSYKTSTF
uniref:Non-muscle caldesmon n=1 Tax=Gadus morhua TaxID=8049 RepID=A0A8C5F8L9_GADMO